MAKQTVTLNPGESQVVTFETTPSKAKTYQVSVDGLTSSFSAVEMPVAYDTGIGIFDEIGRRYTGGIVIVDGVEHFTAYHWIEPLPEGSHTFDLIVPSGYQFIRFEIYNWETGELLRTTSSRPVWVEINTRTYIQGIVHPT